MTYIPNRNVISVSNSTTVAISASTTFTGEWEDVSNFDSVVLAAKTDQDGTMTVQFSPDGTNQDSTLTRYYRTGQIEAPHRFTITRQYCRVTFENTSATNQTYLRVQTMFAQKSDLNAPCDSTLSQDFDATVVRPTSYHTEIALGRRQGNTLWNKFGYNADIDVGTEVVASWGGTFTPLLTASTISVSSSSTADATGSSGTTAIYVYGIDENRDIQEELINMNGTTVVTTSTQWLGINRFVMYTVGTGMVNAGKIQITAVTGGSVMAEMPVGEGVTQQCIFHVPRNHQFMTNWMRINSLKQSAQDPIITVKFWVWSAISNGKQEVYRISMDTGVTNDVSETPESPFPLTEQTVCWLECTTDKADTVVNARFSGELIRDADA